MQRTYVSRRSTTAKRPRQYYTTGTNTQDRLSIFLSGIPAVEAPPRLRVCPCRRSSSRFRQKMRPGSRQALTAFFSAPTNQQAAWKFPRSLEKLLREQ